MSKDKNKGKNKYESIKPEVKKNVIASKESLNKVSRITKEEWSKIDIKGLGAGDRPKK